MADKELIRDPKYAPPYPQDFHAFWPKHALRAGFSMALTFAIIVALAYTFQVPTDPNMPPLPDEGMYIPGPEWYLFLIFQPFWYLTGDQAHLLPLGTFWLPLVILVSLIGLPFVVGRKKWSGVRMSLYAKVIAGMMATVVWAVVLGGTVGAGYPAKTTGCLSCHNVMMGVRQALPPADIGKYYRESRQRQIDVGRYRIGTGVGQSYKDANWQLRHFYEPTMTW